MSQISISKLRNGTEEATPLVAVVLMHLEDLLKAEPIVLYELILCAKNPARRPFGNTGEKLARLGLLTRRGDASWYMHDSERNIICSAVDGDDLTNIRLVSPLAPAALQKEVMPHETKPG